MIDRFALNAALERLLGEADTFDEADAAMLIASVPLTKPGIPFRWSYTGTDRSRGVEGYASGHGNVTDGSERTVKKEGGRGTDALRVGGYTIVHRPGTIVIELMWAEHRRIIDQGHGPSQAAMLHYHRVTKQPRELRIERVVPFTLWWPFPRIELTLGITRYVPWKKPATRTGGGASAPPRSP